MKKILLIIIFFPIFAVGAEWKNVAGSAVMTMQIDLGSISAAKSGVRKAWKEYVFATAQKNYQEKLFTRSLLLSLYNCSERTIAQIQEVDYDNVVGGAVVSSVSIPQQKAQFIDVIPGSFDEEALNFVCAARTHNK